MNSTQYWNAIYIRSNFEKKVGKLLDKKGIIHYYPQHQVVDSLSHERGTAPLLPSIIFIQLPANLPLHELTQLPNITNLVYWQHNPAVFPASEINLLRNFLETHEIVRLTKITLQPAGENQVQQPVSTHYFSPDNVHTISLPSIGYSLSAKAEPVTNIKLVRKNPTGYRATESLAFILGLKTNSSKFE